MDVALDAPPPPTDLTADAVRSLRPQSTVATEGVDELMAQVKRTTPTASSSSSDATPASDTPTPSPTPAPIKKVAAKVETGGIR
jgi:hypothetical protein